MKIIVSTVRLRLALLVMRIIDSTVVAAEAQGTT
jgi:hypothetical protein